MLHLRHSLAQCAYRIRLTYPFCQNGSTALWHAIWKDRKEVAIHLKEAGADINAQDVVR